MQTEQQQQPQTKTFIQPNMLNANNICIHSI